VLNLNKQNEMRELVFGRYDIGVQLK